MTLTIGRPPEAPGPATAGNAARGFWPLRDLPVVGWLVAVVVATAVHPFIPAPRWLMIHLLLLGAAGHAILVWSRYFADTLVRLPATPRAEQSRRLVLFNLGVLVVAVGVPTEAWWVVVVGAVAVVAAVLWHVFTLVRGLRTGFANRFAGTVHFYLVAGSLLPVGVVLGTWLAQSPGEPLETRIRLAHVAINLLGWIGLTVLGTVVTLGPTMLRTRIVAGAERLSRKALLLLTLGIATVVTAAVVDLLPLAAVGVAGYAVGAGLVGWPLLRAGRVKAPASFPTWSVGAGLAWFVALLVTLAVKLALVEPGPGAWADAGKAVDSITPYLAAGFVAQVLLGAISYLVPVVAGGGPAIVRVVNRAMDAGGALRVVAANAGLVVCVLPVPSLVRVIASLVVLTALAAFVPILLRAVRVRRVQPPSDGTSTDPDTRRGQPGDRPSGPASPATARPKGQNAGLAAVGLAAIMLSVALGGALDPASLGGTLQSADGGVAATGNTVEVTVEAKDMRFTPDRIEVQAGDRLVITVVNTDPADVHDLVLETGHDSGRLAPGEEAVVDVGVVGRSLDGWCSVVGHRQMGMVMTIVALGADGAPVAGDPGSDPGATGDPAADAGAAGHSGHGSTGGDLTPTGGPADDTVIADPDLPPLAPGKVHRHTFTVTEQEMEVAPGITQTLWTFNGTAPGPTLRGKVGDTFIITLVNNGSMGHSIDFHAGERPFDKVMKTIPPGGSLEYRFTARRSGIWMYHCSTMPMSVHIANGMFGAVVIDPPDLPEVDRSLLMVQSEHYYGAQGQPVDAVKVLAEKPDAVVFNGYRDAYSHEPIKVKVGERIRVWLLNAGPNRALSFHVVGDQFDRTYAEGAYLLGDADGPAEHGGSQALGLLAAQGGFVELVFDEPGVYPLVNHVMVDMERGAMGVFEVSR